jgi:hypothetical protein
MTSIIYCHGKYVEVPSRIAEKNSKGSSLNSGKA